MEILTEESLASLQFPALSLPGFSFPTQKHMENRQTLGVGGRIEILSYTAKLGGAVLQHWLPDSVLQGATPVSGAQQQSRVGGLALSTREGGVPSTRVKPNSCQRISIFINARICGFFPGQNTRK